MERLRELLARLGNEENPLSDDEREELRSLIADEYARLDALDTTPEVVAEMAEVVDAAESLAADDAAVAQAMEEAESQREEQRRRMRAVNGEEEPPGDGDGEGDGEEEGAGDGDGDAPVDGEDDEDGGDGGTGTARRPAATRTPAGAGAGASSGGSTSTRGRASLSAMRGNGRGRRSPETREIPSRDGTTLTTVLVASADVRGFGIGQELPSWDDVGAAFNAKLSAIQRQSQTSRAGRARQKRSGSELVMVASAKWEYPEERRLIEGMEAENSRKVEAIAAPQAVVASGGTCLPVSVDYSVPVWAVADRPLRDALPGFGATRGGLTFVPPPALSGLAGATTIWTEANDVSPSSPATKPVLRINCGSPTTVYVDAIPTRVEVGNFMGRFAPEWTGANLQLAVAAAARIAETNVQQKILNASTLWTSPAVLGATRDILDLLDRSLARYRYVHRIPESVRIRVLLPDWARYAFRSDLAQELAHDNDVTQAFAITDAQIEGWFSARGCSVTWFIDYLATQVISGVTIADQFLATPSAGAAAANWPGGGAAHTAKMLWYLFVEGTFQFLDGGELDLGVVRDSILDSTNDYETFIETFEGVAFRGLEADAYYSTLNVTGSSKAGV